MKKVVIYTTTVCPYCSRAKALLDRKSIQYEEINVQEDALRQEMMQRSGGRRSVPQIFIGDVHIGGCDDLHELEHQNKLDSMLQA